MGKTARPATDASRHNSDRSDPLDVGRIAWVAEQLDVSVPTAYRMAAAGEIPGLFKVRGQWRVSKPRFLREVHGEAG
jgi:excisionase family DNA binding protein